MKKMFVVAMAMTLSGLLMPPLFNAEMINSHNHTNTAVQNTGQIDVWIMHPRDNNFYLRWRAIWLGEHIEVPFAIIVGPMIYKWLYGVTVTTGTNVGKVELYVDGKLKRVDYKPDEVSDGTALWQIHWCRLGYHEIKVIGYDNAGHYAEDSSHIWVIP
ncbi:MAG: hypothetical protein J7L93_01815 [Thermoplasmata archaeon]|nr:hypothetical protein [Thermoplasmata archaeon]